MNILNKIVEVKRAEIEAQRNKVPVSELTKFDLFKRDVSSLSASIRNGNGIIAEFKRKSPSAGVLSDKAISEVVKDYTAK